MWLLKARRFLAIFTPFEEISFGAFEPNYFTVELIKNYDYVLVPKKKWDL